MGQPKHRRRAARRRAQRTPGPSCYVHITWSGAVRNPLGKVASLDTVICVGFGSATVFRDGVQFCDGDEPERRGMVNRRGLVTLRQVEKYIRRQRLGHHRWSASVHAPLYNATWERRRPGKWVCVETGEGFA